MHYYALINDEGYIIGLNRYQNEITNEYLIKVDSTFKKNNKKYDFETKTFIDYFPEPIPEPEPIPTQLDRIEGYVKQSYQDIIDNYTMQLIEEGVI